MEKMKRFGELSSSRNLFIDTFPEALNLVVGKKKYELECRDVSNQKAFPGTFRLTRVSRVWQQEKPKENFFVVKVIDKKEHPD